MRFVALAAIAALAGCSPAATLKADRMLAEAYIGKPADQFFLRFGPPSSDYVLDSGDRMYLWAENATVYRGAGKQTFSSSAPVVTSGGIVVQCEVRIVADRGGVIRQILAQNDTVGKWQLSRCHELFSQAL